MRTFQVNGHSHSLTAGSVARATTAFSTPRQYEVDSEDQRPRCTPMPRTLLEALQAKPKLQSFRMARDVRGITTNGSEISKIRMRGHGGTSVPAQELYREHEEE